MCGPMGHLPTGPSVEQHLSPRWKGSGTHGPIREESPTDICSRRGPIHWVSEGRGVHGNPKGQRHNQVLAVEDEKNHTHRMLREVLDHVIFFLENLLELRRSMHHHRFFQSFQILLRVDIRLEARMAVSEFLQAGGELIGCHFFVFSQLHKHGGFVLRS